MNQRESFRAFSAGLILTIATFAGAIISGSFILTLIGCVMALGFTAMVTALAMGPSWPVASAAKPQETSAPSAAPSVPPPLDWPTPDSVLDDMLGVANPPPPDIDPDTGELLGDRVCRIEEVLTGMERTIEQLGNLIGEQSNLMANGLLELRRRVDGLTPEPEQQQLPLRQAS